MSETRRQHFVPQWYLRRFGSKRALAVFDRTTGRIEVCRPSEVAFEVGLYDFEHPQLALTAFERVLSNVENHAAPACLKATVDGLESLSAGEREAIAAFVATQHVRVPSSRPALAALLSERLDRARAAMSDDEVRGMAARALTSVETTSIRGPRLSSAEPEGVMPFGIGLALNSFTRELLDDYTWSLHEVTPGELITCDVPVRPLTDRSRSVPWVTVAVPLARSHVLFLESGPAGEPTVSGVPAHFCDEFGVPSLSVLQKVAVHASQRWLFGHPDNPLWKVLTGSQAS